MNYIYHSNLLQSLGWAVFNSLWQMAFLWVAYQLLTAIFKNSSAAAKSNLAFSLLVTGFGWFILTFLSGIVKLPANNNYFSITESSLKPVLQQWLIVILPVASLLYLILLTIPVINFIRNYRYVHVIRTSGLSRPDVEWKLFVQKVSSQIGIQKNVQLWMSELVSSPVTIGYLKPIILLPVAAMNQLSIQQTEAIILHELAHIRRHDYIINLISKLIQSLLYFNPFTTAFLKIIQKEREKSCDQTVIQFQYEPHGYASALLTLEKASYNRIPTLALAAEGKKSDFRQRIEWILGIYQKPSLSFTKVGGILAAVICFVFLNALLILKNTSGKGKGYPSPLAMWGSPMNFTDEYTAHSLDKKKEVITPLIVNHPSTVSDEKNVAIEKTVGEEKTGNTAEPADADVTDNSPYSFVKYIQEYVPALDTKKEKQITEAIAESQRVLKEIQWKSVEKNIADAMTLLEKDSFKKQFKEQYRQIDTAKIANQMRLAYDNINWDEINVQLNHALAEITLDSLQQVYTIAISNLNNLQKELKAVKEPGIPDTDITVDLIDMKKKELEKAINKLKTVHPKKIVKL